MAEKNEVNLKKLIENVGASYKYLLKKWKLIILFSLLCSTIGLSIGFLTNKYYYSKLSFVIEEEGAVGSLTNLASTFGLGGADEGFFNTTNLIEFLKMRSMVEKALLTKVDFRKNSTFAQEFINSNEIDVIPKNPYSKEKIKFLPMEDRSKFSRDKDSILGDIFIRLVLDEQLQVSQPNIENSIIQVDLTTRSELFSRYFPEVLINVAGDFYIESKTFKLKNNVNIISKQLDSVRNELMNSLVGAASASDDLFGLNPTMNVKRVGSVRKQVDVQINTNLHAELVKNLEIAKLKLMNQTPSIQIVDTPILPLEIKKYRKLIGLIVGGFLGGFLVVIFLLLRRLIRTAKEN